MFFGRPHGSPLDSYRYSVLFFSFDDIGLVDSLLDMYASSITCCASCKIDTASVIALSMVRRILALQAVGYELSKFQQNDK